jgi:chemotaxis protein histidine kinase CheA
MSSEEIVDGACETIPVSNTLRAKIAVTTTGSPDALFQAADNAIVDQARGYLDRARAEVEEAGAVLRAAIADPDGRAAALDSLYRIAHDMKGQAATFGYPLATDVAALLCKVLAGRPRLDAAALKIAETHVNGLSVVLRTGLSGDGGATGVELLARLRTLAERVTG